MRLDSPNKWERPSSKNMGFMFSNPKTPLHDTNIITMIITFNRRSTHKRYIESLIFFFFSLSLQIRNKEKGGLFFSFFVWSKMFVGVFSLLKMRQSGKEKTMELSKFCFYHLWELFKKTIPFLAYLPNCHRSIPYLLYSWKIDLFLYSREFQ